MVPIATKDIKIPPLLDRKRLHKIRGLCEISRSATAKLANTKSCTLPETEFLWLDIGTADGALFKNLRYLRGVGIDLKPWVAKFPENAKFLQGKFPEVLSSLPKKQRKFDAIVLLAVMEHIPQTEQQALVRGIHKHLQKGGYVILTIPSPLVDYILDVLKFLRLIDGMEDEQHYGFEPQRAIPIFELNGFKLHRHRRFQLGLNHLFVFTKT